MSEISRILDQMDRAFSGDAWHGPSLWCLLEGIPAEDASRHSVRGAHSIWELVNHVAAWNVIVARRLAGESPEVTSEMDWPPVWEASEVTWKRSLEHLTESHRRVRMAAEGLRDDQLDDKLSAKGESAYVTLHGLIQHDLYHAGQIAILKKKRCGALRQRRCEQPRIIPLREAFTKRRHHRRRSRHRSRLRRRSPSRLSCCAATKPSRCLPARTCS